MFLLKKTTRHISILSMLILSLFAANVSAQNEVKRLSDELPNWRSVPIEKSKKAFRTFYNDYEDSLRYWNFEEQMAFAQKGYDAATIFGIDTFLHIYAYKLGAYYMGIDSLDMSLDYLNIALENSTNKKEEGYTYNGIAGFYGGKKNYNKALDFYFKSLKIAKTLEDKAIAAYALGNISVVYRILEDYENAIKYTEESIFYAKKLESPRKEYLLIYAYADLLTFLHIKKEVTAAYKAVDSIAYSIEALGQIATSDEDAVRYAYTQTMDFYLSQNKIQLAQNYLDKINNLKIRGNITQQSILEAKLLFLQKKATPALAILDDLDVDNIGFDLAEDMLLLQIDIYSLLGDKDKVIALHQKLLAFQKKKFGEDRQQHSALADAAYESLEKESENKLLKAENIIEHTNNRNKTYLAFILILALFFAIGWISFVYKAKREKEQLNEVLEQRVEERTKELFFAHQSLEEAKNKALLNEAKSRFFANVSHEFRTPISLIQAPIQSVLKRETFSTRGKQMLQQALKSSKELLYLVSQILDLSKLDANKMVLEEENVVFNLFIRRVIASFETYAERKNITLKLEYQPNSDIQIAIDKDKFEKIINNYISNALKFTPKNGAITIIVKDFMNRLQVAVQDTGIGIATDELEAVFDRYYQVKNHPNYSNYIGGSGIGLSLCKDYAALFNGRVWAESPVEGSQGSIFYFEFPKKEILSSITDSEAIQLEQFSGFPTYSIITQKKINEALPSILIVEDNHDLRHFLTSLLEENYNIIAVENGKGALEKLPTIDCELIISDVMMPIMDGFELLKKLKSSDKYRHIPIMMLTARGNIQDKLKALRVGVDDYMLKPFHEAELKARVNNLTLNFSRRQEVIAQEKTALNLVEITGIEHSKIDSEWLITLENTVVKSIKNFDFNSDNLAEQLLLSRSALYTKVKKITGLTVNQYIKEVRLQTARLLLENQEMETVKEIVYSVGFKHSNYFSKSYEQRFGKRPSEYF